MDDKQQIQAFKQASFPFKRLQQFPKQDGH